MIISLHVTHANGGVEAMNDIREQMESSIPKYLGDMMTWNEYVILKTCNRFEIYVGTDNANAVKRDFDFFLENAVPRSKFRAVPFILQGKESIKHLFRVSCGLDSLVVGEDQIQGQVREAYVNAKKEGHVSKYLTKLFDKALAMGKKVRAETKINAGSVSVGSAAVEIAERRLGGLNDKVISIIGAGNIADDIVKNLKDKGPNTVFISSRTLGRAAELAFKICGTALSMDYLMPIMSSSDVVFVATSAPHTIITKEKIANHGRPLLIIDVSVPKNVDKDVMDIPNVRLETMDDFKDVTIENIKKRQSDIYEAERILNNEIAKLNAENLAERSEKIIGEIGKKAAAIREEEISKARSRLASANINEVLEDMSRAMLSKLLSDTYEKLRNLTFNNENEILYAAKYLFGLED